MKIPYLQNLLVTVLITGCLIALAPLSQAGTAAYQPQTHSSESSAI